LDLAEQPVLFMDRHPEMERTPVPTEPYVSADFFEKEREKIFRRTWINVARETDVPEPNDYLVREVQIARTSVLIVRGKDNVVRAFHNMCSHRGNPVAWDERGKCRGAFTCQFHGWVYNTQGELVYVADADRFFGVDPQQNGLTPIHCDVWQGFIFVNFAERPSETLAGYMAPITAGVAGYPFADYSKTYCYKADEAVNWKTLVEAQLEGWHLPTLHAKTLAKSATNIGKRFTHSALDCLGPHGFVSTFPPDVFNPSPVTAISGRYGVGTFDAFAVDREGDKEGSDGFKLNGAFDLYHVFPNLYIGLLNGTYFTYNIWPVAVDRTIWEITGYFPTAQNAGQLFAQQVGSIAFRDTLREDGFTHERICSVMSSGAKKQLHLQDEEMAIRNFMNAVNAYVAARPS